MIDFAFTNSGDLKENEITNFPKLRFSWIENSLSALKLSFKIGRGQPSAQTKSGQLRIHFTIKEDRPMPSIVASHDFDALRQMIIALIRGEEGELDGLGYVGSQLVLQKHRDITSKEVQEAVRSLVYDKVSEYLNDPSVVVEKSKIAGHPFSCQNLNVYIYEGKTEIYNFEIGG